ncbi:hypothetical protein D3C72_532500 [compost metagenome]
MPGLGQPGIGGAKLRLRCIDVPPVPVEQGQRHADPDGQGRGVLGLIAPHAQRGADVRPRPDALDTDAPFRRRPFRLGDTNGRHGAGRGFGLGEAPVEQAVRDGGRRRVQHGHRRQPGEPRVPLGQGLVPRSPGGRRLALGLKPAHQGLAPLLHQPHHGPRVGQNEGQGLFGQGETSLGGLGFGVDQREPSGRVEHGEVALQGGGSRLGAGRVHARAATAPQFQVLRHGQGRLGVADARERPRPKGAVHAQVQRRIGSSPRLTHPRLGGVQRGLGLKRDRRLADPGQQG